MFEKYDKELQEIMEGIKAVQKTFSNDNPWIMKYENAVVGDTLTCAQVSGWIDSIAVVRFEFVEVHFKEQDWFHKLPAEWFVNIRMEEQAWHERAEE